MLQVHHLANSRSQRILWLLEELGVPYEIVRYARDPRTNLAPPELKRVHPLGKSPVITDGDLTIAESGAIVTYLLDAHGQGRMRPAAGTREARAHEEWLHYAEGSAMVPLLLQLYVGRLGEAGAPLHPRIHGEIDNHLSYVSGALGERDFLVGDALTGADVQMMFVMDVARAFGKLGAYPNLARYLDRLTARPAFQRAIEKGGPYKMG